MGTRTHAKGGIFPDLLPLINRLRTSVLPYTNNLGKTKYRPRDGCDEKYDSLTACIEDVKRRLDQHLKDLQMKYPNANFSFGHQVSYRYEVRCKKSELPDAVFKSVDITGQLAT